MSDGPINPGWWSPYNRVVIVGWDDPILDHLSRVMKDNLFNSNPDNVRAYLEYLKVAPYAPFYIDSEYEKIIKKESVKRALKALEKEEEIRKKQKAKEQENADHGWEYDTTKFLTDPLYKSEILGEGIGANLADNFGGLLATGEAFYTWEENKLNARFIKKQSYGQQR